MSGDTTGYTGLHGRRITAGAGQVTDIAAASVAETVSSTDRGYRSCSRVERATAAAKVNNVVAAEAVALDSINKVSDACAAGHEADADVPQTEVKAVELRFSLCGAAALIGRGCQAIYRATNALLSTGDETVADGGGIGAFLDRPW